MKNFVKNIILLVVVLLLSYLTAQYFGSWYDKFSPQYGDWVIGKNEAVFFMGLPLAYVFFVILLFRSFGFGSKNKWIGVLLIPPALLWIFADFGHIYFPIILGVIAFVLAFCVRRIYQDLTKSNPLMVIK